MKNRARVMSRLFPVLRRRAEAVLLLLMAAIPCVASAAAPDAPTAVTARVGDASALVQWTSPTNTSGLLVTGYTATATPGGATCTSSAGSPPATSCSISGLTNDTAYTFEVTATTADGTSQSSTASAAATPLAGTQNVNFIGTNGSVKWNASTVGAVGSGLTPVYNSGGATSDQVFTAAAVNSAYCNSAWKWMQILCDLASPNGAAVEAKNNPAYVYKSTVDAGYTIDSTATTQGYVVIDLGAVTNFTTLRIFQMFSDGKVTDVSMSISNQTGSTWPAFDDNSWTTVVPRSPVGTGYSSSSYVTCPSIFDFGASSGRYVRLDFWNRGQFGSPSWIEVSAAKLFFENTVTAAGAGCPPEPPTNQAAIAGNASATVSWTPPSGTLTGFQLQKSTNNGSSWSSVTTSPSTIGGSVTSALVTGLSNNTAYVFRVLATNAVGSSPYSSITNAVTPTSSLPNPPSDVTATAGSASAVVAWTASTGATSYQVSGSPSGSCTATAPDTTCTITGLTNGLSYTFTVTASSAGGTSGSSLASAAVSPAASAQNSAPTVSLVAITGTAGVGQTLTGSYTYNDTESDTENTAVSGSSCQWFRGTASNGTDKAAISGANGATGGTTTTYVASSADLGKYLFYCVTPKAGSGTLNGTESCTATGTLIADLVSTTPAPTGATITTTGSSAPPPNPYNTAGATTVTEAISTTSDGSGSAYTAASSSLVANLPNLESKVGISDNGVVVITATTKEPVQIQSTAPDNVLFSLPTAKSVDIQIGGRGISVTTGTDPVKDSSGKTMSAVLETKTLTNDQGASAQTVQVVKGQAEVRSTEANQIVGGLTLSKDVTLRQVTATGGTIGSTVGFYKNPTDLSGSVSAETGDVTVHVKLATSAAAAKARSGTFAATVTRTLTLKAGEVARFDKMGELIGVFAGSLSGTAGKTGDALALTMPAGVTNYPKFAAKLDANSLDRLGNNLLPAFLAAVIPPSVKIAGKDLIRAAQSASSSFALTQDATTGVVTLTYYGRTYTGLPLMPIPVDTSVPDGGVTLADGTVVWTEQGVSVHFAPAVADLPSFAKSAQVYGVSTQVEEDGTLKLSTVGTVYFARPRFASDAVGGSAGFAVNPVYHNATYVEGDGTTQVYGPSITRATFTGADGKTQIIDPTVYDASQIAQLVQAAGSGWSQSRAVDGAFTISGPNGQSFKLLPDYAVQLDTSTSSPTRDAPAAWVDADGKVVVRYNTGFLPMTQHFQVQ